MRRLMILLAFSCLTPSSLHAQTLTDDEKRDGFVALFNGKDFSGWRFAEASALPEALPGNWKVMDGVIHLTGGGSPHLASQWDYEDFDVRLQWRGLRDKYNSGFYVRSGRKVGANQINLAKGAEGALLGGTSKAARAVPQLQKPPTEWNEWRVLAVGAKVTFWCNGQLAWEVTDFKTKRGYLGLQAEGAAMEFRNVRIKEIGYQPLDTAKRDYKDYVLRLEWQGEEGATGGVGLRGDSESAVVRLGSADGSGALGSQKPAKKLDVPAGQWNYLEVRVQGGSASVWLNGTTVVDKAAVAGSGPISLQTGAKPVRYRNVRVKVVD